MLLTYKKSAIILNILRTLEVEPGEGAGTATVKIAHNIKKLSDVVDIAVDVRTKLFKELSGGRESIKRDDPLAVEISNRMDEVDNTEVEVKLWKIDFSSLKQSTLTPEGLSGASDVITGVPDLGEPDA